MTKTGTALTFGKHVREGRVAEEWHLSCGCAWHPTDGACGADSPHWHPCTVHAGAMDLLEACQRAAAELQDAERWTAKRKGDLLAALTGAIGKALGGGAAVAATAAVITMAAGGLPAQGAQPAESEAAP